MLFTGAFLGEIIAMEDGIQSPTLTIFDSIASTIKIGLMMATSIFPDPIFITLLVAFPSIFMDTTAKIHLINVRFDLALNEKLTQTFFAQTKSIAAHVK
jgi:hypothetical protein